MIPIFFQILRQKRNHRTAEQMRGGIHDEEKHRRSVVLFEKIIPAERREKVNRRSGLKSAEKM